MESRETPHHAMHTYRTKLRSQGLRPVQLWVHDTRTTDVRDEIQRQAHLLASTAEDADTKTWLEDDDTSEWEA